MDALDLDNLKTGEKMKTIKKIGCIGLLGLSTLILSACDDNPMNSAESMAHLERDMDAYSLKEKVNCVEYASDPDSFEKRRAVCSKWLYRVYENYNRKPRGSIFYSAVPDTEKDEEKPVPTYEQFTDSEVWQVIWNDNKDEWTKKYAERQERERKEKAEALKREQEREAQRAEWEKERKERELMRRAERKARMDKFCARKANRNAYLCTHRDD